MDYTLYQRIFEKILVTNRAYHCQIPSLNLHDKDLVTSGEFQVNVPRKSNLGVQWGEYYVLRGGEASNDLAKDLVMRKAAWIKKREKLRPTNEKNSLRQLKRFRDGRDQQMSLKLRRFVDHMRLDPLPGFECDQNWLYSGGTVTTMCEEDGGASLLSCSGPGLSCVSKIKVDEDGNVFDESSVSLKINDPILQITSDPTTSLVSVRQKNNLSILKPSSRDFDVALKKKVRRSNYFTSVAMNRGVVALTKNLGKVVLFDVEVNKLTFATPLYDGLLHCPVKNSWSQVHWRNEGLWVLKKKMLNLIDPRGWNSKWDLSTTLEDCEDICNYFESSCDPSSCYLSTTHSLFQVDVRQQKVLKKWSHMMQFPPTFGQSITTGDDELVILQSSDPDEAVVVGCGLNRVQVAPLLVPGVPDGLRSAQLRGHCLVPEASKRANYTITGTHLFPCEKKVEQLKQVVQNAGGDIFIRNIHESNQEGTMEIDHDATSYQIPSESWNKFGEQIPIQDTPYCSEIVEMTNAFDLLKIPRKNVTQRPRPDFEWKLGNDVTKDNLHSYKDLLAEPILEVWNIDTNDVEREESDEEVCADLKVEEWLSRNAEGDT